jgi:hypothetical protein
MPAYRKEPPYLRFLGNPRMSEFAYFAQKHADIKIKFHQDLKQMEEFQEMQVKTMSEEYTRKSQLQMIEDELKRRGEL